MLCSILTLFPELLRPYLDESILGIAQRIGRVRFHLVDFRQHAEGRQMTVDDRPFGGGPGMVLKPDPIFDAVETVERHFGPHRKLLMTPRGRPFDQTKARELATEERVLLLCGRYEGFDERIRRAYDWEELALGDYVLSGGELPALSVMESVIRLLPDVLGDAESAVQDSFTDADVVDHPHYTRPRVFRGMDVPEVLTSGDHGAVELWRRQQRERLSKERRERTKGKRKSE